MWFKLATADFTDKNLGTMADIASSWGVSYTTQGGISKNNCPTIVKMNDNKTQAAADFTATFTLADGATLTSITATLKSSGAQLIQVTSGNSITIPAASITGDIVITAIASGSSSGGGGSEGDDSTTYTITYICKNSSGTTLKTTTETGVAAGTNKTFTTSGAPAISGYTCTSVSPTSATINSNTTVTYTYTANASGEGKTITWSNQKYQSGTGLVSANNRALARIPAVVNDCVEISGLEGYVGVDFVGFKADGSVSTTSDASTVYAGLTINDGTFRFMIPSGLSGFTGADITELGLVVKKSTEATIDLNTLPTTHISYQPMLNNYRFNSSSTSGVQYTFIAEKTRLATDYLAIGSNRTITITDMPSDFLDLQVVDFVFFDSNKNYLSMASGSTSSSSMNGTTMTITIPSHASAAYIRITMKKSSNSNANLYAARFLDCTVTST